MKRLKQRVLPSRFRKVEQKAASVEKPQSRAMRLTERLVDCSRKRAARIRV